MKTNIQNQKRSLIVTNVISYSIHTFKNPKNTEKPFNLYNSHKNEHRQTKKRVLIPLFLFIVMSIINLHYIKVRVAQRIARWTSNPEVVGSNPTVDAFFLFCIMQ